MVGAGTVCADDPSLRCRMPGGAGRWRVVVDARGRVGAGARVCTDEAASDTVLATTPACSRARRRAWASQGARVWTFRPAADGRLPLRALLRRLARAGIMHVLCEGGGELAGALIRAELVDEYRFFYAPAVMGDARAVSGVRGCDFELARMPRFTVAETRLVGGDVMVHARRVRRAGEKAACSRG